MPVPTDLDATAPPTAVGFRLTRFLPLAVIAVVSVTVITMGWHKQLSLVALVDRRGAIDAFVAEHRIAAFAAFAGIYALAVALSLPGAAFLTICCGMIFGAFAGGLTALVGATAGATVIFLIAKSALGGWLVRRAGRRTESLAAGFCADAFNYLLFLRLVPVFPFWLVNLVPALCGVGLATFVAGTALGIIPGTFAFAFFGAGLDSAIAAQATVYRACFSAGRPDCHLNFDPGAAVTPQLIIGLVALGVLALVPIAVKQFKAARAKSQLSGHH
jgi:uncharacterized membrane protein YdjX (TVP38/TMEM64 family)